MDIDKAFFINTEKGYNVEFYELVLVELLVDDFIGQFFFKADEVHYFI